MYILKKILNLEEDLARSGFEPLSSGHEPDILPLYDRAISNQSFKR